LSQHFQIPQISTGEILRAAIAGSCSHKPELVELAAKAKPYLDRGELVPDELMIAFIRDRLSFSDVGQGWLLEGYPRTAFQAEELDFLLEEVNQALDWAIWLDVPEAVLIERCQGRARADDDLLILQRRIQALEEYTTPLLDYYGYKKRLIRVDGSQLPDMVGTNILNKL
jgi:adenylate kinase